MEQVDATELKNRLGRVLAKAILAPVAIVRHGKVVAVLGPPGTPANPARRKASHRAGYSRAREEELVRLCARGDFRPSRWQRAGDRRTLAGIAVMLASQPEFDRVRLLALAETLEPGMSRAGAFARWLAETPVRASRFLPMVRAELKRARE
jgi:antitoxin (DNA-binding transcriptional repressor) of toxin-antitoxin stability system